jgi:hypothetical protein
VGAGCDTAALPHWLCPYSTCGAGRARGRGIHQAWLMYEACVAPVSPAVGQCSGMCVLCCAPTSAPASAPLPTLRRRRITTHIWFLWMPIVPSSAPIAPHATFPRLDQYAHPQFAVSYLEIQISLHTRSSCQQAVQNRATMIARKSKRAFRLLHRKCYTVLI